MARKVATTEAKRDEPYATIVGYGKRSYFVRVYRDSHAWSPAYERLISSSKARAEAWAEKKLAKLNEIVEHEKFSARYTY